MDQLAEPAAAVRYDVRTLYVPHGATELVRATGEKLEGLDLMTVGTAKRTVAVMLAGKTSAAQLRRKYTSDMKAVARMVGAAGGNGAAAIADLTGKLQGIRTLLASPPATVEVKLQ